MLAILKTLNLALAFLLELVMLVAIGYWGFQLKQGWAVRIAAGIGLPVVVAVVWGVFLSPKANVPLAEPFKLFAKLLLFALAVAALYAAGRSKLAIAFGVVVVVNMLLAYVWEQ